VPVLGAALIIAAKGAMMNTFILGYRAPVLFGLISYPLYLWHWPVLVYAGFSKITLLTDLERGLCVTVAIALAWFDISLRRKSDPAPKDTRSNSWASGSHGQCSRRRHYCGDLVRISGAHPFRYQASCEYDSRTFHDEIR
jgi:hypothetical protein